MNWCYLDSSVLMRRLLKQPGVLDLSQCRTAVASELIVAECYRTLDRLRLREPLGEAEIARLAGDLEDALAGVSLVPLTAEVLRQVRQPLAAPLGTLDAIHLCTAVIHRGSNPEIPRFATHDAALGRAARLYGFAVAGT